ncbi:MAG: DUF3857 domain-containing protein [Pyrinomonadaceae bacterium]
MLSFLCLCAAGAVAVRAQDKDKDWRPVSPSDLAAKTPVVEADADAEAIFWEVRVDDSSAAELALRHYVRIKIFTELGRDQFSKHDILFTKGTRVKDVDARVTKPDGSTVLLKKEDVLEREIVKASGVKVKAKSFALPGLEVGSIIEYRYREVYDNAEANMRLVFQREVPIQNISYFVRPFSGTRGMYYEKFNTGTTQFEKDKNGFYRATMTNVPAFRDEPSMAPEDDVKSWMYIYYQAGEKKAPEEYWRDVGKYQYERSKETMKASDEVKSITATAIAGARSEDEKLYKMFEFVKSQIRNLNYSDKVTDDEWKKAAAVKSPTETLRLKYGTGGAIDNLFGAMARAAGFDARPSFTGSRNEMTFNRGIANASLMVNAVSVAVKVGDAWQFFSPGSYFTCYGMLSWAEEGQVALIADSKEAIWQEITLASSDKSRAKRTGKFKLLEDGSLEGEATMEYTGHWAAFMKTATRLDSPAEQENKLKALVKSNLLGTAEVDSYSIENLNDPEKSLIYRFKVRVPGYASRTGKRLFFQPNVFERSSKPRFTANTRKHDVYINYPYSVQDEVSMEFPNGFALESGDSPQPIKDRQGIASHQVKMGVTKDGKTLIYHRDFSFGNNGLLRFPVASYPQVKALFEAFNKADVHQLTLRESAAVSTSK